MGSNIPYSPTGGELSEKSSGRKVATPTQASFFLDRNRVSTKSYTVDQHVYSRLKDIGYLLDFYLGWDSATSTITIDTTKEFGL
ncbi:MAG: hypothetical protein LBM98_10280 [Oscillospiraceae bacterium]|nr:hypothetical protein [Oscillospiraceae bacterium]